MPIDWIAYNKARIQYWLKIHRRNPGNPTILERCKIHIEQLVQAIIHDSTGVTWQKAPDKDRWVASINGVEGIGDTLLNACLDAIFPEGVTKHGTHNQT